MKVATFKVFMNMFPIHDMWRKVQFVLFSFTCNRIEFVISGHEHKDIRRSEFHI
jgi:hypothetical protein